MRHNNTRRPKGGQRNQQGFNGNNNNKKPSRTRVFDSNGPDVRIRGTAWQVTEKYQALAKDAEAAGHWVMAENYHQHAEHYQRIINEFADETPVSADKPQRQQNNTQRNNDSNGDDEDLGLPASILGNKAESEKEEAVA